MNRTYLCIDLKSFYASVECVERGLDPMTTDLVVADPDREGGTICLAVSPSLKAKGVKNRCRVFEIPPGMKYIMAPPRMQKYIDYAADIYALYLRYFSPEDIHVYSIDECFIDVTTYLDSFGFSGREMADFLMTRIDKEIGVRATAGVGPNLYLTKIALDIMAKHSPDFIGELDEESYKEQLWDHRPLTDFWRTGPGTAAHLERLGIFTMRQLAHYDEDRLYRVFGIDAELMIDHAWGRETCTIADIQAYKSKTNCISTSQVLMRDYSFEEGKIILREMLDSICLDMVDRGVITGSIGLYVSYSKTCLIPGAKATVKLPVETNADSVIIPEVLKAYERTVAEGLPIRRFCFTANNLMPDTGSYQLSLFETETREQMQKNRLLQQTVLDIRKKFGKDAMMKGTSLEEAATGKERNHQIGGHKSGE